MEPKKAIVDAEVAKAAQAAEAANSIKRECEAALAVALPVLESALCAPCLSCFWLCFLVSSVMKGPVLGDGGSSRHYGHCAALLLLA